MKRLELNTDDETLREILGNGKQYYVPRFQRDYSWENEHWENLWADILDLTSGKIKYHYMGYLVIQPPSEEKKGMKPKIIDGQQRLTTFSLLILSAIKRLKELKDEKKRINRIFNDFIGSEDLTYLRTENKLKLNRNNDYYYRQAVLGHDLPKRGKKRTVHLMEKAIVYFFAQLKKYDSGEKIGRLIEEMSNRLLFTTIYIGNELNAYKVFESLNARGVQLSSSDLLKNHIFSIMDKNSSMPDGVLDELDEQWKNIGENIGNKNYTNYILSEWNSRYKIVRKTELFKYIRRTINTKELASEYLTVLDQKSITYAALQNYEDEFWKDHQDYIKIKENLYFLNLFNISQPISLLLAVYHTMPNYFSTVLHWIKNFSMRYNIICKNHPGEQETLYNQISLMVKKDEKIGQIKEKLLQLYPTDIIFKQSFCHKSIKTEQSNKKGRHILAKLEEHFNNSSIDETRLTVEHILPLNPNDDWQDAFGENWNLFKDRIGNMALVSPKENKLLAQKPFKEKKIILLNTSYGINKNIEDYFEWKSETIESRQRKLADSAVDLWKIN